LDRDLPHSSIMANHRPTALFFIFLLMSTHAYRIDVANKANMDTASVANATNPYSSYGQYQYSVVSRSTTYRSAYSRTTVGTYRGSSYASSAIHNVEEYCADGLYAGHKVALADPGFMAPEMASMWPLLVTAGVILMGGLYLYHRHRMNGPIEPLFCPVSSWESDPSGMLVGPAAHEAYQLTSFFSEDNNRGMPKCHGLRRHRLRADCDGDVDCKRQACRQMCCDRQDCTFFQFNTIDSIDNCWLGSRSRLSTSTCEQPFFGETCTTCRDRQAHLWPQIHENNMKCHSAMLSFTGFHVENQYECQAHAVEQGHEFYQYDSARQKCETEATCENPSSNTIHDWKIFSSRNMPAPEPAAARPPAMQEEWQFEPFLFHENRGMTTVQLTSSQRCTAGDVTCMRDACRAQCLQHDWCIHYQFENSGDSCDLGASHVIDEDDVGMWFGGILIQNRQCTEEEYKCPSSHECVSSCGECGGHSRDGPEGWCVRSAVENIVDADQWDDNYNQHPIDAWCRGLERSIVTVSQAFTMGQSGADICRAACSSDQHCALWQMYPSDAENTDFTEGDHVRCWLGMEDRVGQPRFSCTGRSPKRWRLLSSPLAGAVRSRGCQDGKVACVMSQMCVNLCSDECPGFPITDTESNLCQPPLEPQCISDGVPMNLALAHNLPSAVPNAEYSMFADEGDLFTMSLNLQNLINPDTFTGDTAAVCDVIPGAECEMIDGACVCEYDDDVDCDAIFGHPDRVSPVLAEEGMMVLSHDRCSCSGRTCTLRLLSSVPPVRTTVEGTSAVQLAANDAEICLESTVCPNMDRCEVIQYGAMGCGHSCENEEGRFWCSSRCDCNKEEAVRECAAGVTCPDMDSCDPISYGEYGCGYGCMKDVTYYFCNDVCTVCNV